jgi:glycosyltransferase involved in cell wall biosynthesis
VQLGLLLYDENERIGGHKPLHGAAIAAAALNRGWTVHVCSGPLFCDALARMLAELQVHGDIVLHRVKSQPWIRSPGMLSAVNGILYKQLLTYCGLQDLWQHFPERERTPWVHLLNGDECAYSIAAFGSPLGAVPVSPVLFADYTSIDTCVDGVRGRLKALLKKKALTGLLERREVASILTTNPLLARKVALQALDVHQKLSYIQDIGAPWHRHKTRNEARQEVGLSATARVVLCYGNLDSGRKNIRYLLDLLERDAEGKLVGLLVGTVSPDCRRLLEQSRARMLMDRGKLFVCEGFASSQLENLVFSAADAVWLAYKNFKGPSGVLELACAAEVPVIACMGGVIGEIVSTERVGTFIGGEDLDADYRIIMRLFTDDLLYQKAVAACRHRGFQGGMHKFGNAICDAIAKVESGAVSPKGSGHANDVNASAH